MVKLLAAVFEDAVQVHASDIHYEPDEKVLRIRQRINGVCVDVLNEVRWLPALVLRLKLLAGLDIFRERLPQDRRFNMRVRVVDRIADVDQCRCNTANPWSCVCWISEGLLSLHDAMQELLLQRSARRLRRACTAWVGLVTGPTRKPQDHHLLRALSPS